jgi:hypothetical protein
VYPIFGITAARPEEEMAGERPERHREEKKASWLQNAMNFAEALRQIRQVFQDGVRETAGNALIGQGHLAGIATNQLQTRAQTTGCLQRGLIVIQPKSNFRELSQSAEQAITTA